MEPGVNSETGTAVPVFKPKRMSNYARQEVSEKLPMYREFLLKYKNARFVMRPDALQFVMEGVNG